jgi:hypothetical protein
MRKHLDRVRINGATHWDRLNRSMLRWFEQWKRNRALRQYYKGRYSEWFDLDADYFSETPEPGAGPMREFDGTTAAPGLSGLKRPVSSGSPLR